MKSMTGYGKATLALHERTLTVEVKTVNNRFLEIGNHMPKVLACCEDVVRSSVKQMLSRGSVDLYFDYVNNTTSAKAVTVDVALADAYVSAAKCTAEKYGWNSDFNVSSLFRFPDVLCVKSEAEDDEILRELTQKCVCAALASLNEMREREGATVCADLKRLADSIEELLAKAKERAPLVVAEYREKIAARVAEALKEVQVDEARLLNEVAFFADKADINEEMQRLSSHIVQFNAILVSNEPAGRKLDFLSQEMNREINTMGSKSNDKELTALVLAMKNELEKIKEQIRNVE